MTKPRLHPDKPRITPETERAVVRDYCTPGISIAEIQARHGVTHHTINRIRQKWGLRRNQTHGSPTTSERVSHAEPAPTLYRCTYCNGPSSDPPGHSACVARNQPKGRAA